ncbi:hypothetical protein WJX73_000699 [Symbiochloris irregularis]|uniref:Uncharacterized protein n=1 Tax=Symbiochloris irregularis TaxID=706552 RepID=A0AAW1NUX9_9CHLO
MSSCARRLGAAPVCHSPASQITAPRRSLRKQLVCQAKGTEKAQGSTAVDSAANVASSASALATFGLLTPFLLDVHSASAHDPLLTGRYISLVHPAMMFFLFGATVWTGWLGLQWRRLRTLPAVVKDLKAQLPKPDGEGNRPSSPLDAEIKALESERKQLAGKDLKGVHHNWGGLLLGLGVFFAVAGPLNTYLRSGKLFPGPHLYAGAGIVILWAAAAALVPQMAKGSEVARTLHITFNCLNLALFAWQIPTGLEIVGKVLQFAPVP